MSGTLNRAAHYQVHQRLASGGMGEVYLGTMSSPAGNRPVAVKQVAAGHLQLQEAVLRLIAEAKLGFQLRHANICQVLDLVLGDEGAYLILEFVEGMNLRELVKASHTRLDVSVALHAARETARALDYAHRARSGEGAALHTVHGDVTPQNILISVEGEVKLADFGIARALGTASPGSDLVGGTLGFMAPEVVHGNTDHRSDIYSLGATLHYALVGQPPQAAGDISALHAREDLSTALKRILARSVAVRPEDRYSSAAEFESQIALEMARRFPAFTASVAAATVRGTRRSAARKDGARTETLFTIGLDEGGLSLAADDVTQVDVPWLKPPTHTAPPVLSSGTMTLAQTPAAPRSEATVTLGQLPAAPRRSQRPAAVIGIVLTGLAALVIAVFLARSDTGDAISARAPASLASSDAQDPGSLEFAELAEADAGVSDAALPVDVATLPVPLDAGRRRVAVSTGTKANQVRAASEEAEPAFLSVNSTPWGAVEVDGHIVAQETPLLRHAIVPGRHRVVVVFGDGSRSKTRRIHLKSGQRRSLGFVK